MKIRSLVILPSYNSGLLLAGTMTAARREWQPVWAVIDGSTDGSDREAECLGEDGFRVIRLEQNSGKGGAILQAFREAKKAGYTHALVMDADGQHPAEHILPFMEAAERCPTALIAGWPVFGPDAPIERVRGRLVGNFFASVETWGKGVRDSLFGFRLYPIVPALKILESTSAGRRFDFDTVLAVRLVWDGVPVVNCPVPVRYPPREAGGVTHFRYLRDNLLLARVHFRLFLEMVLHIPTLLRTPKP